MAIDSLGGAIGDLTGLGDGARDRMEILADLPADRDAEEALFERCAEAGEEFGFEAGGELAKVHLGSKGLLQVIAETDACPGVVETDFATALQAWPKNLELIGSGGVLQTKDLLC